MLLSAYSFAASFIPPKKSCLANMVAHAHNINENNNDGNNFIFWVYIFNFAIFDFICLFHKEMATNAVAIISLLKVEIT